MSSDDRTDAPPPCPRSVRVVGWGLILMGSLWTWTCSVIFAFLFAGLGIGVLRGSDRARRWSAFVCTSVAIFIGIVIALGTIVQVVAGLGDGIMPASRGEWLAATFFLMTCVLSRRALTRPNAITWFEAMDSIPSRQKLQFRISTALLAMLLISIALAQVPLADFTSRRSFNFHRGTVIYGLRDGRTYTFPDFIVISDEAYSGIMSTGSLLGRSERLTITRADGPDVHLAGTHQLYEIKNGELRAIEGTVTKQQLDSYLNSNPERPSIEDLLKWRVEDD